MTYAEVDGGHDASAALASGGRVDWWTPAAVQERLVEAMRLWWRSPGGGKSPFAADAPWELMTRKTRVAIGIEGGLLGRELQLHMQAEDDAETRRREEGREHSGALTRDDVARRDEASEWLTWIADDARKVVTAVLVQLASGRRSVDWKRVKASVGSADVSGIGNKGVYRRYTRAITVIVMRLNGGE